MPIRISHEGNVGQAIGLNYAGALGQYQQRERAQRGQQALGYARIRAQQENLAFQAEQNQQLAEMQEGARLERAMMNRANLDAQRNAVQAKMMLERGWAVEDKLGERDWEAQQGMAQWEQDNDPDPNMNLAEWNLTDTEREVYEQSLKDIEAHKNNHTLRVAERVHAIQQEKMKQYDLKRGVNESQAPRTPSQEFSDKSWEMVVTEGGVYPAGDYNPDEHGPPIRRVVMWTDEDGKVQHLDTDTVNGEKTPQRTLSEIVKDQMVGGSTTPVSTKVATAIRANQTGDASPEQLKIIEQYMRRKELDAYDVIVEPLYDRAVKKAMPTLIAHYTSMITQAYADYFGDPKMRSWLVDQQDLGATSSFWKPAPIMGHGEDGKMPKQTVVTEYAKRQAENYLAGLTREQLIGRYAELSGSLPPPPGHTGPWPPPGELLVPEAEVGDGGPVDRVRTGSFADMVGDGEPVVAGQPTEHPRPWMDHDTRSREEAEKTALSIMETYGTVNANELDSLNPAAAKSIREIKALLEKMEQIEEHGRAEDNGLL